MPVASKSHKSPALREPLLVAIVGPTGAGKTALSLALGEHFQSEVVNCDSIALYRDFEIGTAKPSPQARAALPHHLLDVVSPTQPVTAGEYARMARVVLQEIKQRGHMPIVVGGSGLYLRALLDGLFPGPKRSEKLRVRLRASATQKPAGHLHRMLSKLDPAMAVKIHAHDTPKLIRAIEVCLSSREKISQLWQRGRDPLTGFRILRIGLDPQRDALYQRINARALAMFEAGLVEETRRLYEKYGDSALPLASLGYRQALQHVREEIDEELAMRLAQQAHRNYAKRQLTWFRREPGIHWFRNFGDTTAVQRQAIELVARSMTSIPP